MALNLGDAPVGEAGGETVMPYIDRREAVLEGGRARESVCRCEGGHQVVEGKQGSSWRVFGGVNNAQLRVNRSVSGCTTLRVQTKRATTTANTERRKKKRKERQSVLCRKKRMKNREKREKREIKERESVSE